MSRQIMTRKELERHTERITSRSSGPGGQHVNKSETRIQLRFDIKGSDLRVEKKARLLKKYPSGFIQAQSQETRSQARNEERAFQQLDFLIQQALKKKKARKKTQAPHQTKGGKAKKALKAHLMKYRNRYIEAP